MYVIKLCFLGDLRDQELNQEFSFGPPKDPQLNKNVRFDVRAEAALAAHDYRVAHATRKAIRYTTELHKTFAVRFTLSE